MAAMTAIVGFSHLLTGFDNKTLTALMGTLLDAPYTSRQATYDLRPYPGPGSGRPGSQTAHRAGTRSPLATAWRQLDRTLDRFIDEGLAAA